MTPPDPDLVILTKHLEAMSLQLVEMTKRIDRLDGRLDDTKGEIREQLSAHARTVELLLDAAKATLLAEVKAVDAKIDFPVWGVRLIVGAIVVACLAAAGTAIFKLGQESQRTIILPTTPPAKETR